MWILLRQPGCFVSWPVRAWAVQYWVEHSKLAPPRITWCISWERRYGRSSVVLFFFLCFSWYRSISSDVLEKNKRQNSCARIHEHPVIGSRILAAQRSTGGTRVDACKVPVASMAFSFRRDKDRPRPKAWGCAVRR